MKTVLMMLLSTTMYAQDTLNVIEHKDDMTGKIEYFVNKKAICANDDKTKGFSIEPFINEKYIVSDIIVTLVGLGGCLENSEIIILLEDDSKITIKSWNDFNCKGNAYFSLEKEDIDTLSKKKVKKIRVTNGRTFDSFTGTIRDNMYFIKLFRITQNGSK